MKSSYLPIVEWIGIKRDGGALPVEVIHRLIPEFLRGRVSDAQMSALLMAIALNGMSFQETVALTEAMLNSGRVLSAGGTGRPRVDKHSTGGVGDKISLCLAPLVSACGVDVPMIAGRGLGHTGGTLDKLEAIEGYDVSQSISRFQSIVRRVGVSIMGQTATLAPADRRIYALRDVTGTVPSAPLIVASILSKKLAAGLDALVMDVKVGRGAFMTTSTAARELAHLLRRVGKKLGTPVRGLLTNMSEPIGRTIGNSLETAEALAVLRSEGPDDTRDLTLALGVEMLRAAGVVRTKRAALQRLRGALSSGAAAEKMEQMIAAHGGDAAVVAAPERLPQARHRVMIKSSADGIVQQIDALELGLAAVELGAGRSRLNQVLDPAVGIELLVERGASIKEGEPLAALHVARRAVQPKLKLRVEQAFRLGARTPPPLARVLERF